MALYAGRILTLLVAQLVRAFTHFHTLALRLTQSHLTTLSLSYTISLTPSLTVLLAPTTCLRQVAHALKGVRLRLGKIAPGLTMVTALALNGADT